MDLSDPIAIGNTAKLYLYDNKMFKVFNKHFTPSVSLYEAKKQEYAYTCGLDVPKILEVTEINGSQAIVMEYVNGKTVGELLMKNMEQAEYYIHICVNTQQKMHGIKVDPHLLEPMAEKLHRQIELAHDLNQRQKDTLLRKLASLVYEPRLCHGDFHPFNLIISNEKIYIIDWIDSSSGDIRADIYRTYLLFSQASVKLAEMYLHIYCKNTGLLRSEIFQWEPIIAGARLSENVSTESNQRLMEIVSNYCDSGM